MFQNFKHQIACRQCSPNPMTMTDEYSLLPKSTSSTSTKSPLRRKIQHFSGEDSD